MGGIRRLPPKPPALPPVSSKAKDYSMDRPSEVQNELDELRNWGLAKMLNRHFTDTTKKLAKEKASADAALADLERRRANTSEFIPSKGGELNPFDSMYVELQQKRTECRRKEKETMLLYQRYVHKYGKKTKISAPTPTFSPVATEALSPSASNNSIITTPEAPPPPSPSPMCGKVMLQPLDENSEAVINLDVNFSKFYSKQLDDKQQSRAKDPPTKAQEGEERKPDRAMPELQELNPQASRESGAVADDPPELRDEVAPVVATEEDFPAGKATSPQTGLSTKVDPPVGGSVKFAAEVSVATSTPSIEDVQLEEVARSFAGAKEPSELQSASVSKASDASEPAALEGKSLPVIASIQEPNDPVEIVSDTSDSNRPTHEVTAEMPTTAASMAEDDDDRSVISGLTMTSRIMTDEIELEMDQFLKTETEAIRKMLDEEEESTFVTSMFNSSSSVIGDESRRASVKAEAMAKEMQKILDDYATEDPSVSINAEETDVDDETVATTKYPRKYGTSDPAEEWMIYYDESYQREYYFEKTTKRSQWEAPGSSASVGRITQQIFSEDVAVTPIKRSRSRREVYRTKVRKRRIRRFAAFTALVALSGGSTLHWKRNHPEKAYHGAMIATWDGVYESFIDNWDSSMYFVAERIEFASILIRNQIEHTLTNHHQEDGEEKREDSIRSESERRVRVEAEARKREQQKANDEAEKASLKAKEEVKRKELERKAKEVRVKVEETRRRAEEEAFKHAEEERKTLHRPWGCNLPLAYIHPRCNRLAKVNPIYKETDILNSFMQ